MRKFSLLSGLLLIVGLHFAALGWLNRPRQVGPDAPAGKLRSLSFAPFREGYSPLEKIYPLPEQVEEDVHLLADKTRSIRTYTSLGGLQPTPGFARKYGLKMIAGGWLSAKAADNRREVDALVKSANENPDVVERVIIGNEVLLRGEMGVDRLIEYIREVKRAVRQPVSYADVWSMYMKYPQLIAEVDFITIHVLPYWEDEPISIDQATEHLEKVVRQIEDEARGVAPGKPILIGESGWPGAGRQRGRASPGVVNEARFVRGLIEVANRHGFDYNIVEAFNQPWKSHLEGVVGANWGLFSADRREVFPLTGPVSENPRWRWHWLAASVLVAAAAAQHWRRLCELSLGRALVLLLAGQIFCIELTEMAFFLWRTTYSDGQRVQAAALLALNAAAAALLTQRAFQLLHASKSVRDSASHSLGESASKSVPESADALGLAWRLRVLYYIFGWLALLKTLALALVGRYLSFPAEQFAVPVFGVCVLAGLAGWRAHRFSVSGLALPALAGGGALGPAGRYLGYGLLLAAAVLIGGETWAYLSGADFVLAHPDFSAGLPIAFSYTLMNTQLIVWLIYLLVLAVPFLAGAGIESRGRK